MHVIEHLTTDTPDHIDYRRVKLWIGKTLLAFSGAFVLFLIGFMFIGDLMINGPYSSKMAAWEPVLAFVMMSAGIFMMERFGRQLLTMLDPLLDGKVLDAREFRADPMDEMADQVDQVIAAKKGAVQRESDWVRAEEAV